MPNTYAIFVGTHTCDCAALKGKLVDLPQGGRRKLRSEKKGFAKMVLALAEIALETRAAAGIPDDVHEEFLSANLTVSLIDQLLPVSKKLTEVLEESRAFYVDARENYVGLMVDMARSRAKRRKNPSILTPFEAMIEYHGQRATKAARTRKQAKARRQGGDGAGGDGAAGAAG